MAESLKYQIVDLQMHADRRGWLVEMLKTDEMESGQSIRQIYAATIEPGCFRGGHYHKKRIEWFFIVGDNVEIILEDIKTKERKVIPASLERPQRITIYPGAAHAVFNRGDEAVHLLSAQNNIYDPQNSDTYEYKINRTAGAQILKIEK